MPNLVFRTHEWLAERCSFIQFPRQQLIPRQGPPPGFFKHAMPLYLRFGLAVFGIILIGAAVFGLGVVAVVVWAAIKA